MLRLVLLLLIIAGVAGYFTKPDEAALRAGADAVLSEPQTISEGLENIGASVVGDRQFDDYYVASRYTVTFDNQPVVQCWGAFQQVKCDRVERAAAT